MNRLIRKYKDRKVRKEREKREKREKQGKVKDLEKQLQMYKKMWIETPDNVCTPNEFECEICNLSCNIPQMNDNCGHTYCKKCWEQISTRKCPKCRAYIGNLVVNYALMNDEININEQSGQSGQSGQSHPIKEKDDSFYNTLMTYFYS